MIERNLDSATTHLAVPLLSAVHRLLGRVPDPESVLKQAEVLVDRAHEQLLFFEVLLALVTLILLVSGAVFGAIFWREGRLMAEARAAGEATIRALADYRAKLEHNWEAFDKLMRDDLRETEDYIQYAKESPEEAIKAEDLDRLLVVADGLGLTGDLERSARACIQLGRRFKKAGDFARAARRFHRAGEIVDQLDLRNDDRRVLYSKAHLYLAALYNERAAEWVKQGGRLAEIADWRARVVHELQRVETVNDGRPTAQTLFQWAFLRAIEGYLDTAVHLYRASYQEAEKSTDLRDKEEGLGALYNAACTLCRKATSLKGSPHTSSLQDALSLLTKLPTKPWIRYMRNDDAFDELRRSWKHPGQQFRLLLEDRRTG